jgi:hypothetical protein
MLRSKTAIIVFFSLFFSLPVRGGVDSEEEAIPERFRFKVQVEEVSTRLSKTIVFRTHMPERIEPESWAFYIFDSRPHVEHFQHVTGKALRILMGMGRVPCLLSWDCKTRRGVLVPEGKYYLLLWIKDKEGKRWISYWQSFKVG